METSSASKAFALALRGCDDEATRTYFSDPAAIDDALALEAFLASDGDDVFTLYGRDVSDYRMMIQRFHPWWIRRDDHDVVVALDAFEVLDWLCESRQHPDDIVISDLLPYTIGHLFIDLVERSFCENNTFVLELLLESPTFVDMFTPEVRVWTLAALSNLIGSYGTRDNVNILVAHGINVDGDEDVARRMPWWDSNDECGSRSLEYLVANGATNVGLRGIHPLIARSQAKNTRRLLSELICLGLDVNAADESVLHIAAREKNADLIHVLVTEAFTDIDARDASGRTPLMRAVEIVQVYFPTSWEPGNVAATEQLLAFGADVNAQDHQGRTALTLAPVPQLQALLSYGADPNIADHQGWTPLHYLSQARLNVTKIASLLLDHGADVQAQTLDGSTPLLVLIRAAQWYQPEKEQVETIEFFLKRGADPNLPDYAGTMPLDLCLQRKRDRDEIFIQVLRSFGAKSSSVEDRESVEIRANRTEMTV